LAPVVAVLAVYSIVMAPVIEWQFNREPTASRLRAKGQTDEHSAALVGMVMMLTPVSVALLASLLVLSGGQLVWYSALSLTGLVFWGWRYRRVIYAV
jgi:hypothetical protein